MEAAVRDALGKVSGSLLESEVAGLTTLSAKNRSIANLTGLEFAVNLLELDLSGNAISDPTPLAGLTNPFSLTLYNNNLDDIGPLQDLTHLETLLLRNNQLTKLRPLATLEQLSILWLGGNNLADLTGLETLSGLTALELDHNQTIEDLTPLGSLRNLSTLTPSDNAIQDLTPLATLTNLGRLYLHQNQISDVRPLDDLRQIWNLNLEDNLIDDITPLADLPRLLTANVRLNHLAIAAGTDDREVVDRWIGQGAQVLFDPQKLSPLEPTTLRVRRAGDSVSLQWSSRIDASYHVQTSTNLTDWIDAHPEPLLGSSGMLIQFTAWADGGLAVGIRIHGSRYGLAEAPNEPTVRHSSASGRYSSEAGPQTRYTPRHSVMQEESPPLPTASLSQTAPRFGPIPLLAIEPVEFRIQRGTASPQNPRTAARSVCKT